LEARTRQADPGRRRTTQKPNRAPKGARVTMIRRIIGLLACELSRLANLDWLTFWRCSNRGLLPGPLSAFGGMRDWKDLTHIIDKRLTKALSVAWQWATLVPLNCNAFLNGLAAMRYADNLQIGAIRALEGWNDCHTLANLRQSKQGGAVHDFRA
jgi:hypothetical protein